MEVSNVLWNMVNYTKRLWLGYTIGLPAICWLQWTIYSMKLGTTQLLLCRGTTHLRKDDRRFEIICISNLHFAFLSLVGLWYNERAEPCGWQTARPNSTHTHRQVPWCLNDEHRDWRDYDDHHVARKVDQHGAAHHDHLDGHPDHICKEQYRHVYHCRPEVQLVMMVAQNWHKHISEPININFKCQYRLFGADMNHRNCQSLW